MDYGGHFDPESKKKILLDLEDKINSPTFWQDKNNSEGVMNKYNSIKSRLSKVERLKKMIDDNIDIINLLKQEEDSDLKESIISDIKLIEEELNDVQLELLLSDQYDSCDCILDIHPGAGGTESCDWASMLYRMYLRWCEKHDKKVEVIDYQLGEEAGIKSASIIIRGFNSYGYLKNEKGVHRLIRISPFDSNKRRHTSFASVDITPLYNDSNIDIEIKDSDIRIDTYCASGHGGQGVNTTPSAVRITHFPSKIVVTCQNERSQIRNKETCLTVLKNKLYNLELEKRKQELQNIKGGNMDINFGSQIRTYTMCPYKLVKDHRTNTEITNVDGVLDGDIDKFIFDNLKMGVE